MLKRRRWVNVCILAIITLLMLMPSASGYWWIKTPPLISDHSVIEDVYNDELFDVKIQLRIFNTQTTTNSRNDKTGTTEPTGEQVQIQPGTKFVWTCYYEISARHNGELAPEWLVACDVRVYLHYYWCPYDEDGSQTSNYQLLHSNWVSIVAFYDEDNGEDGMLHGVHQNHENVPGEHYCAELSWYTRWNDGSWHYDVNSGRYYFYEMI